MNFYNENDPFAAQWLRNLIAAGLIPPGEVDERSIADVRASDLEGFTQCHFFAGIGGWSYALRLAGWPDDSAVWTGSCPCQPLSSAGAHKGHADERHLWPAFYRLIAERRPATIFGEQVASKDGREWLAGVRADLEDLGYAIGASDLCAASAGAPHIRQRLWWVAHADGGNAGTEGLQRSGQHRQRTQDGGAVAMAYTQRHGGRPDEPQRKAEGRVVDGRSGFWAAADGLVCTDGKTRRIEPGSFPLAHGIPNRMGQLRGYGNAIVPQVAALFIEAAMTRKVTAPVPPKARSAEGRAN